MDQEKQKQFTKFVSLGWWLSFLFMIAQTVIITLFNLKATPIIGIFLFASFVILSFSSNYDKNHEFSPYKGLIKIFNRNKNR